MSEVAGGIGLLRERPLHAALKVWYAVPGDAIEVSVDGFVIDLVRDGLLIEIQTRGFAGLRPKLDALLAMGHRVRVVHPIAVDRWIVRVDANGAVLSRRRSPRHGNAADLAVELVSFPNLVAHPAFELEVLLTAEEEVRCHEPGRCWRRRGWTTVERRLLEVVDRVLIGAPGDLAALLPATLPDPFTSAELAAALGRPTRVGQQLAYCLRAAGVVAVGRRGRFVAFRTPARTG